jgi:O-antigen/teichoic acid export membrane protein
MSNTINIGKKDVLWHYIATFLKMGVGVILLPFILKKFPQETITIWTIFSTIIAITSLLDFGFKPSFTRNVSYVMSGVKEITTTGYQIVDEKDIQIDYCLFKGLIMTMRWLYASIALLLFILLSIIGTWYIYIILHSYNGNHNDIYISWFILIAVNTYSLYTYYYDALMQGQGKIKRSMQIQVCSYLCYLSIAISLIFLGFNLIAIVSAQAFQVIINRILVCHTIYTPDFRKKLDSANVEKKIKYLKHITPNAVKVGLNGWGHTFLIARTPLLIGSLFLPLSTMASYGILVQIVTIIWQVSTVYFYSYQPKIIQRRIFDDIASVKLIYLKSCWVQFFTFTICGLLLIVSGNWILELINSKTLLPHVAYIITVLFIYFLDMNYGIAEAMILTKNDASFYKASLITGIVVVVLLFVFLKYTSLGIWGLILAPGIAQACYCDWKWNFVVMKELKISISDIFSSLKALKVTIS